MPVLDNFGALAMGLISFLVFMETFSYVANKKRTEQDHHNIRQLILLALIATTVLLIYIKS